MYLPYVSLSMQNWKDDELWFYCLYCPALRRIFFFPGCLKKFTQSVVSRIHVSSLLVHLDLGKFNILPAGPQKSSLDVA